MIGIFKVIKPFIARKQPEILMTMGISGMIFSTVWAVKATFKASQKITDLWYENGAEPTTKKEIFKEVWKLYLPSVISAGVAIPCIIAGNRVSNKRNAALAAAYTISETAFQEYQERTKQLVGEKKEAQIHESASKEIVDKTYSKSHVLLTGDGETLFHESLSGRYFKSNWNKILKAANELNASALTDAFGVITLTDWFTHLGLDPTDISDYMGWSTEDGTRGLIDISIDSVLTPDNNTPCGSIHYNNRPKML